MNSYYIHYIYKQKRCTEIIDAATIPAAIDKFVNCDKYRNLNITASDIVEVAIRGSWMAKNEVSR